MEPRGIPLPSLGGTLEHDQAEPPPPTADGEAALAIDSVLDRVHAWQRRKSAAPIALPVPKATVELGTPAAQLDFKALSYNPAIVTNAYEPCGMPPSPARTITPDLTAATAAMAAGAELGLEYTHKTPQILSTVRVPLLGDTSADGVLIRQVRVVKQHESGRCGHHALHNALCASLAALAETRETALDALSDTQSEPAFWSQVSPPSTQQVKVPHTVCWYARCTLLGLWRLACNASHASQFFSNQAMLVTESARRGGEEASWPWSMRCTDHRNQWGEIERSHMTHLLKAHPAVRRPSVSY